MMIVRQYAMRVDEKVVCYVLSMQPWSAILCTVLAKLEVRRMTSIYVMFALWPPTNLQKLFFHQWVRKTGHYMRKLGNLY